MSVSGGNGGRYIAVVGAFIAAILILAGTLFFSFSLGNLSGHSEADANGYSIAYQDIAAQKIANCLREPVLDAAVNCISNADTSSRDAQRDEADLNAQRQMADWAWWVMVFTGFQLLIGGAGLGALIMDLSQNRKSSERQLRAYLAVVPLGIKSIVGNKWCIGDALLRNVGATPAFNVSLKVNMEARNEKEWSYFDYQKDPITIPRALHPGGEMLQVSAMPYVPVSDINSHKYIYVWGIARYDDVFGVRHFTKFCYRYDTGSSEQSIVLAIQESATGLAEERIIISAEKAHNHHHGNDAD